MIKKIISIKAIGKFKNYEASDISLKPLTGIYSENGRGKTTISSIFRSLSKNNPKIILGRRRLNETGRPNFKMELDSGFVEFKNDVWDKHHPDIEIFDSHFISENLYSGMQVDINQKRNLYKFIIGDEAIKLNHEVVTLNDRISNLTSEIREKRNQLTKLIGNEIEVPEFLELKPIDDVEMKIAAKEKEVSALQKRDLLLKKEQLGVISFPSYNLAELGALLATTLEDVSRDAELKVKNHVDDCLSENGEDWLKTGLELLGTGSHCPFCKSDISKNDLVSAYKSYFSELYSDLKEKIVLELASFKKSFSATLVANITNKIKNNQTAAASWGEYVEIPSIEFVPNDLKENGNGSVAHKLSVDAVENLNSVIAVIVELIEKKRSAPLDCDSDDLDAFAKLRMQVEEVSAQVTAYNGQISKINIVLDIFRKGLGTSDLGTEKTSLSNMRAAKNRYTDDVKGVCDEFLNLEAQKNLLEKEKDVARLKLDEVTKKIPEKYQEKINGYLERFGADFRIYDHRKVSPRGEPATEYKILINGAEVPVGDANSPDDVASFKNTLSEGDKNTLAFSYFLAKLDSDERVGQKIVVFDDPISSLDNSRREWTKSYLRYFGGKAKQLIVMSHDSKFLEEVHRDIKKSQKEMCCLKIGSSGDGSHLETVDFADLNKSSYMRNLERILKYLGGGGGDPSEVIKAIRPLCEDYIKGCCPNSISASDNLGSMIRKIREAPDGSDLASLKPLLVEFDNLNAYTTKEHHGQSDSSGPIDETQLKAQCTLSLKIIGEDGN